MPKTDIQDGIDTGRDDAVDTSTNEEDDVDDLETDTSGWDDGEVVDDDSEDDSDEDDTAGDSEDDDSDEEDSEEDDGESDDPEDPKGDKKPGDEDDSADSKKTDKGTLSDEERKQRDNEMAQARMATAAAQKEAADARRQATETAIQRYLDEAGDDDQELRARQNDVEQFRLTEERIEVNTERLQAGIDRALSSIDLFRTGTPTQKAELAASLDDFEMMHVVKDKQGRPIKVNADVVQYLQRKADSIKRIASEGAVTQTRKKSNEKSRTMTPPVRAPKKKQDDGLDAFDAEANRY